MSKENSVERKINAIFSSLRRIQKMLEYFLGTRSKYIGIAAEKLTETAIRDIYRRGGLKIGNKFLPPIKILDKNIKGKGYEIDLLGEDSEGCKWIIETTTYPIFSMRNAEKFCRRVERWIDENNETPCFLLVAYEGIEHSLYYLLEKHLSKLCKKVIILDKLESEQLLRSCVGESRRFFD